MIDRFSRLIIENIKMNDKMTIVLSDMEFKVDGDKKFAHDVAIAFQSLLIRKQENDSRTGKDAKTGSKRPR